MDKNSSDGVPLPQRYGAILTIVLGLTMAVLDGAIANVALPTIASDLNASPAASIWIVNAYQIAIVIALLPLSFLGDMVGYRRIYKIGLVVFIFTSLAMRFLPPNSARSKIIRFDLPSAIMNALTFGLLITALSGFAQGQSTQLVLAEVAAMLVVGFFFVRRQLTMPVPLCRSTCCVSHSSLSLSALPSAPSARRCWRWSPCPFFCSR